MGSRRRARELALKVLYSADLTHEDADRTLRSVLELLGSGEPGQEANSDPESQGPPEDIRQFASELVRGVREHLGEIDQLLMKMASNWRVDRMTTVDRNILRMAIYELLFCPEIPVRVSINEAIELGKRFGSADSPAFINGILDKILSLEASRPKTGRVEP